MSFSSDRFANAALMQAGSYERRFRKYVPFSEIIEVLRRQAAFGRPLKFVLDRDSESAGFFKRGPLWDFGNAGVRFEKRVVEDNQLALIVTWREDLEQKDLEAILDELNGLEFAEGDVVGMEFVSPANERVRSRFGNGISVDKDGVTVHFTGTWQK